MLKKIGLGLAGIVGALFAYAGFQSPDYTISREIVVSAPAEKVFPYLNSVKLADKWGPWLEVDPAAKMSYSGPEAGVGARSSWTGGKELGTGSATIVDSVANQKVDIALEYVEPMQMKQLSTYAIRNEGGKSIVSWTVKGQNNVIGRVMCLFFDMDKMVGGMFEKGLSKLKTVVEN